MHRLVLSLVALFAATALPARADTLPVIVGVPTTYIPGTPFEFELRAPGVVEFGAYSFELVFLTESSSTGLLTLEAFHHGTSAFSFPGGSFSATASNPGEFEHRLLLSDSGPTLNTTAGVDDLLAIVRVTPDAAFTGSMVLSVDPNTLFFAINPEATPEVEPPQPITISQGTPPPPAVPAPAGVVAAGIGLAVLAVRRRVLGVAH